MTEFEFSQSKLNLFLKVTGCRADGYHELETLFLPLSYPADMISIDYDDEPGIRVSSSLPDLPGNLENIAGRAALVYAETAGISPTWTIYIKKNIPVAAGMGGGSSNAGAVLRLLNGHYKALTSDELARLALTLGADVPYFLHPLLSIASGVGDISRPVDGVTLLPPLLVVNPNFPVSAKWAYDHLDPKLIGESSSEKLTNLVHGLRHGNVAVVADNLHNDLSYALYEKFPLLRLLRDTLMELGALNVQITGSGPTLYAVCESKDSRQYVAQGLRRRFAPGVVTVFEDIPLELTQNS